MIGVRSLFYQFWRRGYFAVTGWGMLLAASEAHDSTFLEILSGAPIFRASLPRNRPTKAFYPVSHEPNCWLSMVETFFSRTPDFWIFWEHWVLFLWNTEFRNDILKLRVFSFFENTDRNVHHETDFIRVSAKFWVRVGGWGFTLYLISIMEVLIGQEWNQEGSHPPQKGATKRALQWAVYRDPSQTPTTSPTWPYTYTN
jgi:hypothetical protein